MSHVTINLSDTSQVYDQFSYPAGEWQIRLKPEGCALVENASAIRFIARITQPADIIKLALLRSAVITQAPFAILDLVLPYLPYSRADRRFTNGDCAGLEVFGSLINAIGFDGVFTLDAHNSEAAKRAINRLKDCSPERFIHMAIKQFADAHRSSRVSILFPDEGARKRYHVPAELACNTGSVSLSVYHCHKKRDPATGALAGFEVPKLPDQPALIIDDICDGGGTFVGIAKETGINVELGLYVSHGIFSKGMAPLVEYFSHIYTTTTIMGKAGTECEALTVFDAMPELQ